MKQFDFFENNHIRSSASVFLSGLLMLALLAGCSSSDSPAPSAGGGGGSTETVSAALKEWEITLDKPSVAKSGKLTFKAKNGGTVAHELVVLKTDLAADALQVMDDKVNEAAVGQVIGEIEEFAPGMEKTVDLELPDGRYVLFCNVLENGATEGHYQKGMRIAFTVGTPSATKSALINATAGGLGADPGDPKNKHSYFNFSTGQVVDLNDAAAADSSDWDIAFKRSGIKLNGGFSGKKGVDGFFTENNPEAYGTDGKPIRSWFESATPGAELVDFTAVGATDIPADSEFKSDKLVPAIKGDGTDEGWWFYAGPPTHLVTAVPENWWVVKSAGGNSYVKFHVTEILRDGNAAPDPKMRRITLELQVQPVGSVVFNGLFMHTFLIPRDAGGVLYYDFDTEAEVDVSNAGWDLKVEYDAASREYRILLNGGVSGPGKGGAQGLGSDPGSVTNGADRDQVPHYFPDKTGGIFVDSAWNAYNITGNDHKLWPNYRVYLIKSGEAVFKLQVLAYYHPQTTEAGWYTIRYEAMRSE